jgi:hypothetical protein
MSNLEEKMQKGYEEYLSLPLASIMDFLINEIYINNWFIQTGLSFVPPHPGRHYTFIEFVYFCGKNQNLQKRFIK